jgi:hypothetical protein
MIFSFSPFSGYGDLFVTLSGDTLKALSSLGGYYDKWPGGKFWYKTDYER